MPETARHPPFDNLAHLTGSSPPNGELPTFVPIATALATPAGCDAAVIAQLAVDRLLQPNVRAGRQADAELIASGAELEELKPALEAAYNERYRLEAVRDTDLAPVPSGLLVDPEHRFGHDIEYFTSYDQENRLYYNVKAIERLCAKPRTRSIYESPFDRPGNYEVRAVPDPEAQARAERVIAAFEAWDAECRMRPSHIEHEAAVARHLDLDARYGRVLAAIEGAVPVSLRGLAVQARAMNDTTRPQLLMLIVAERLTEFAKAEAPRAPTAITVDSVPALLAERRHAIADINEGCVSEAESDALMDRWGACDAAVIATPATTLADAKSSIEWVMDELLCFGFHPNQPDCGSRVVLSLLEGALAVLRRELGTRLSPDHSQVDPVIAAIEAHRTASERFDAAAIVDCGKGPDISTALGIESAALHRLVATVPTTLNGLSAFSRHLAHRCENALGYDREIVLQALDTIALAHERLLPWFGDEALPEQHAAADRPVAA